MDDKALKVINLVRENKSANEICNMLNMGRKELYDVFLHLKNNGYATLREYYYSGDIRYKCVDFDSCHNYLNNHNNNSVELAVPSNKNKFKFLIISDTHIGNDKERLDLLDKAFIYCTNNNIHVILCAGDLIDGTFSKGIRREFYEVREQIKHFISSYPYDSNIITIAAGGDHDISTLKNCSVNLLEIIKNYRHDIIMKNFKGTDIRIKNDHILLEHKGSRDQSYPLIISGHLHKFESEVISNNQVLIKAPSLSNINNTLVSALELELEYKEEKINVINVKSLNFNSKIHTVGENKFVLSRKK